MVALIAAGALVCAIGQPLGALKPPPGKGGSGSSKPPAAPGGAYAAPVLLDNDGNPATADYVTEDFPDPFVLRVSGSYCNVAPSDPCYYAYATAGGFLGLDFVPVRSSTDLVHWFRAGPDTNGDGKPDSNAMPNLASWVDFGYNWAPSVHFNGSRYVMYYTARQHSSGKQCIGRATSTAPGGPFVDSSSGPFFCHQSLGGTIDASPFLDGGTLWLTFKTEDSRLWVTRLSADGMSKVSGDTLLLTYAGGWEAPRIEAPTFLRAPDRTLYLFYSGGDWTNSTYAVGVARCTGATGPCTRVYSTPLLATRSTMAGPGGQSPFLDPAGAWRMAFHAWESPNIGTRRYMRTLPLTFTSTGPKIG